MPGIRPPQVAFRLPPRDPAVEPRHVKPHTRHPQMNSLVPAGNGSTPVPRTLLALIAVLAATLLGMAGGAHAATAGEVTLAWDPNPETNIQRYELQYGTSSGNRPLTVNAGINLSTSVPGLNPGTTYYFAVVARNTFGQASPPSAEISYTVPGTLNTAPVGNAASVSLDEDSQTAVTLTATDAEGDSLTYAIVDTPAKGTLSGTPPHLTYKASANLNGADSFTFQVFDGVLHSETVAVNITITPVNDVPVANGRSVTTKEDTSVSITLSGSDPDGDTLSYAIVQGPTRGTLSGTGTNRTYQPTSNVHGSDSFTFTVSDGRVTSAPATVSITVTPVNDLPVANPQNVSTTEDNPKSITLTASDIDLDVLTYSIVTAPVNGTISGNPPNITYHPKKDFNGSDSFTFRVNDGTANSSPATVNVTVAAVNDEPVATSRSVTTARNTALTIPLTGTDVDGNSLTFTVVSGPVNGTLSGTPPVVTYTPNTNYTGSDSIVFRASDGQLTSPNATISISVTNNNRAPQAHAKAATTMIGKPVAVTLTGSDPDANPLSYRIVSSPANGTLAGSPPNLTYKPKKKWAGEDRITFVVNDGELDSAVATITIKVKKKNLKPVANLQSLVVNQNLAAATVLTGSDPDGDALNFIIGARPKNGTLSGTPPNVVYTPKTGFKGKDRFSFAAHDGKAKSKAAVVEISVVNPNNRPPVARAFAVNGTAKAKVPIQLAATDADSDALTFRVVSKPSSGKLAGKGAKLTYKAAKGFTGSVTLTYVANDGSVDSAPATVTISISATAAASSEERQAKAITEPAPLPSLTIAPVPGKPGTVSLRITGSAGAGYQLEHSFDLKDWQPVIPVEVGSAGVLVRELDLPAGSSAGFYRLSLP